MQNSFVVRRVLKIFLVAFVFTTGTCRRVPCTSDNGKFSQDANISCYGIFKFQLKFSFEKNGKS